MAEGDSPVREPATRGRGRGGRGGRGRGRGGGRGGFNAAAAKTTAAKFGRGGTRRGRAKNFNDSRIQAAYERQRDLKSQYSRVSHIIKPALAELAERQVEKLMQDPDAIKDIDDYQEITQELEDNYETKLAQFKNKEELDQKMAAETYEHEKYVAHQEFKNGVEELYDVWFEAQENRVNKLEALHARNLPVDVRDDQYEYKAITDEHYDNDFGIYNAMLDGHLVPYPSRVEGTYMWNKAREYDAAQAAAAAAATGKGKGRGRGANKRKAQDQPEGQPTPKKSSRLQEELIEPPSAPAPAKGLLASAAEIEATPEVTPPEEEVSPEPPAFLINGVGPSAAVGKQLAREKSPPLPKSITEPDEYGFRTYNQRPSMRDKAANSRFFVPRPFYFEPHEIGFRDSANDSSKGHTRAKRGKYLDTPNSNGLHIDCWNTFYDYSQLPPEDFDQETVKKYSVHPRYGIILPGRPSLQEDPGPIVMPGKPVVYLCHPSGRIHHASRSYLKTANHRRSEDAPWRTKIGSSVRRFCRMDEITPDEVSISEYVRSDEELRDSSLGTAIKELEARPVISETPSEDEELIDVDEAPTQPETGISSLSALAYATAYLEAQNQVKAPAPTPAPKPARYDAIRDVFTDSSSTPPPPPAEKINDPLQLLATLSDVVNRADGNEPIQAGLTSASHPAQYAIPESDMRSTIPESGLRGTIPESDYQTTIVGSDLRSTLPPMEQHRTPIMTPTQALAQPMSEPRYNQGEVPQTYMQGQHLNQLPPQPVGPMHTHPNEPMGYAPVHDPAVGQHPSVRPQEYQPGPPPPAPGMPIQEQGGYMPYGGYPMPDRRESQLPAPRPVENAYGSRRMSGYAEPAPMSYSRSYWPQQPPPSGPPAPTGPPPPAPAPVQHYQPQVAPAPSSRMPFSPHASAEPLPPLRPPRGRTQSIEEPIMEPNMRPSPHNNMGNSYYPPTGPARQYHHPYPAGPETHQQPPPPPPQQMQQQMPADRILPNPQQTAQGYMTSPHQSYSHQALSPTYAPSMANQMAQGPPDAQGGPNSVHRHRSTPSGSSDAGKTYRKLQPAPVPAHRVWPNKPELKTIPYDHKDQGSGAALPSSGPTQIRGWNVNQPRKRTKDKQDRSESSQDRDESR